MERPQRDNFGESLDYVNGRHEIYCGFGMQEGPKSKFVFPSNLELEECWLLLL